MKPRISLVAWFAIVAGTWIFLVMQVVMAVES